MQDQYYTTEDDVVEQLSETLSSLCESRTRAILNQEFINISEEIIAIKK